MDILIYRKYFPRLPHMLVIIIWELTKVLVVHECWPNASVVTTHNHAVTLNF